MTVTAFGPAAGAFSLCRKLTVRRSVAGGLTECRGQRDSGPPSPAPRRMTTSPTPVTQLAETTGGLGKTSSELCAPGEGHDHDRPLVEGLVSVRVDMAVTGQVSLPGHLVKSGT